MATSYRIRSAATGRLLILGRLLLHLCERTLYSIAIPVRDGPEPTEAASSPDLPSLSLEHGTWSGRAEEREVILHRLDVLTAHVLKRPQPVVIRNARALPRTLPVICHGSAPLPAGATPH